MKLLLIILTFIFTTIIVNTNTSITNADREIITIIQNLLNNLPIWIPELFENKAYYTLLYIPLIIGTITLLVNKLCKEAIFLFSIPFIANIINDWLKEIVQRPRPPIDYRILEKNLGYCYSEYSYTSTHTITMFCLYGLLIYFLLKYCKNKLIIRTCIALAVMNCIVISFSRIWLGAHNPTDVICAYLLGTIIIYIYIIIYNHMINKKN